MTYKPVGVNESSQFPPRVEAHIQALIDAAVTALINGAPGALDTLKELADQLASDESATAALTTALGTKASITALNSEISRATAAEAAAQAYAIQRGNHTGTQAESTVTNLVSDLAAKATTTDLSTETTRATAAETALQNLTNTTFTTALDNRLSRKILVPAARVRTWGHSYMHGSGTGVTIGTNDMATLIASGLGLPLDQEAVAGAALYNHLSAADWAEIMQYETRPTKFAALGGVYALLYGINDTAYLGLTTTALLPYKHALRAVIARLRSSAVFEDSDSSVTYGGSGTWAVGSGTVGNSGTGFHYNVTSGATITITTPQSFPGGNLNLGFIAWNDGSYGTVTGPSSLGSPVLLMSEFAGTDCRRTGVMRIANVPAGAATYVFTTSSVSGSTGVVFDRWGWEPPESACPIVAVISQPKPLDYTAQAGADFPGTDAGVDALNTVQAAVVAEFGARVLYVNTSALDKSATYFVAGNIHPNAAGHAYIAAQTLAAIETLRPQFIQAELNSTGGVSTTGWQTHTPTVGGITIGSGTVFASYRNAGDNVVQLYGRITLAADSVVTGPVTVSLPSSAVTAYSKVSLDAVLQDSGTAYKLGKPLLLSLDTLTIRSLGKFTDNGDGTVTLVDPGEFVNISATSPFTWAVNDFIEWGGTIRIA